MLIINKEGNEVFLYGRNTKEQKYEVVLSKFGKEIYKGGNIEVLNLVLGINFVCREKDAESIFIDNITKTLGSGSLNLFTLKEV